MEPVFDPGLPSHLSDLGEAAEPTIEATLGVARRLAVAWGVEIDGWLPGGTCSLVLTGRRAGKRVVLRTPVREWEIEASLPALLALSYHGGVGVLESDQATGTALMPLLRPGHTLAEASEEEAVEACADLILRLRGAECTAPSVADYVVPVLEERSLPDALRLGLAADAACLARRLLDTAPPSRFLHGDLHHFNVLRHGEAWVAIDPEGIVGDPAYECAAFLRNPVPELADHPDLPGLLQTRIERFAARLGDPAERIWGWALVRTVQCVSGTGRSPLRAPWTRVVAALDELRTVYGVRP